MADHGMENKWEFTKISLVLSPGYEKSKVVSGDQLFLYGRLGEDRLVKVWPTFRQTEGGQRAFFELLPKNNHMKIIILKKEHI